MAERETRNTNPRERPTASQMEAKQKASTPSLARFAERLRHDPDPAARGKAIRTVGLYRNGEAVTILLEGARDDSPEIRLTAVQSLWHSAADGLDGDGKITAALEDALRDPHPRVTVLAQRALDDLRALKTRRENEERQALAAPPVMPPEPARRDTRSRGARSADARAERMDGSTSIWSEADWKELTERAVYDGDAGVRGAAIHTVAIHRSDSAVDILLQAARDWAPQNRHQAVQALWYSAADGLDKDGRIAEALRSAEGDADPMVARLARRALKDLENLETRRREEALTPAVVNHPPPARPGRGLDGR